MPLPLALPLAAAGVSGALKAVTGIGQRRRARRIRRRAQRRFDRNPYETPAEALQALESAQIQAGQTELPGQAAMEAQITGAAGGAVQATREAAVTPQDVAAGATQAYQNLYLNPLRNLSIQASRRYDANQQNLQSQLGNIAQYRDREWQQNVLLPYQNAMQTAGQLSSAGQQNIFSGVSDALGGISNFAMASQFANQAAANTAAMRSPNVVQAPAMGRVAPVTTGLQSGLMPMNNRFINNNLIQPM